MDTGSENHSARDLSRKRSFFANYATVLEDVNFR